MIDASCFTNYCDLFDVAGQKHFNYFVKCKSVAKCLCSGIARTRSRSPTINIRVLFLEPIVNSVNHTLSKLALSASTCPHLHGPLKIIIRAISLLC